MNFSAPSDGRGLTFEQRIARDTERLRWKMEKAAQRRKASQDGFYDEETVHIQKPTACIVDGCARKVKARGLCERDYKRMRRADGLDN